MKRLWILLFIVFISTTFSYSQITYTPLVFAVSPGCTISELKNDSGNTTNVLYPLIGVTLNKGLNKKIGINAGVQYSFRGANHLSPGYEFRNTYLDIQLAARYKLNSFFKVQLGGQYSQLLTSKFIIPNYLMGNEKTSIVGKYNSQFEVFSGLDLLFQKNASLNFKYSLPIKSLEYTNFQITLNINIDKDLFKRKDTVPENLFGMKIIKEGYIEDNGIIYPGMITDPPQYKDSLVSSLYKYFEDFVRVDPIFVYSDYGDDLVFLLFELKIDTLGKVTVLGLAGSPPADQDPVFGKVHLPGEIKSAIDTMPLWSPALINGKASEIIFYLPLNVSIYLNRITILQSEYMVPFKHRKNKK